MALNVLKNPDIVLFLDSSIGFWIRFNLSFPPWMVEHITPKSTATPLLFWRRGGLYIKFCMTSLKPHPSYPYRGQGTATFPLTLWFLSQSWCSYYAPFFSTVYFMFDIYVLYHLPSLVSFYLYRHICRFNAPSSVSTWYPSWYSNHTYLLYELLAVSPTNPSTLLFSF